MTEPNDVWDDDVGVAGDTSVLDRLTRDVTEQVDAGTWTSTVPLRPHIDVVYSLNIDPDHAKRWRKACEGRPDARTGERDVDWTRFGALVLVGQCVDILLDAASAGVTFASPEFHRQVAGEGVKSASVAAVMQVYGRRDAPGADVGVVSGELLVRAGYTEQGERADPTDAR